MIFTALVGVNRFYFTRELSFNENLKLMKHIKHIRFYTKRIKPNTFCVRIHKDHKITETIRR
jgi:hypothetical protein